MYTYIGKLDMTILLTVCSWCIRLQKSAKNDMFIDIMLCRFLSHDNVRKLNMMRYLS